jgi:transcriptional regulator GlxA family with amidase domain
MNRQQSYRPHHVDNATWLTVEATFGADEAKTHGANMNERRFSGDAIADSLDLIDAPLLTAPTQRALEQKGGLSPSKLSRAKKLLVEKSSQDIPLADIARECGLSRQYFTKSFKATLGVTPHRWLQQYRIKKAKDLLQTTSYPIADIAIECGFADQSHFTRVFVSLTGGTPAAWRREYRS